jgi:hypothetical protein
VTPTKLSLEFLKMPRGKPIDYVPDANIYCPKCADRGRRSIVVKRDMPYLAAYIGREDVDGTACDVLHLHYPPECPRCGYEIGKIFFAVRGGYLVMPTAPEAQPIAISDSGGRWIGRGVSLALVLIVVGMMLALRG